MIKKIYTSIEEFIPTLKEIKRNNKKIVFTNGCFDLIHIGHLDYLKEASSFGDLLIVGLNHDDSIKRLKGDDRPINDFNYRSQFLAYLDYVDYIVGFHEDTPLNLIKKIIPDVLVKGGDYTLKDIVGSDFIQENGGIVKIIPFKYHISTTKIIEKIKGIK